MTKPLTVIVTRPEHQAMNLCQSIEKLGGKTITIPTIAIEGLDLNNTATAIHSQLKHGDRIIFLSANAVYHSHLLWKSIVVQPKIFAIGPATAEALRSTNLPPAIIPTIYSSEGLLALAELQQVAQKNIYICSGMNSRPLLMSELIRRQANVIPIICYRRYCPTLEGSTFKMLDKKTPIITLTTSRECLINFHKILSLHNTQWLLEMPLIIAHPTHLSTAQALGFKQIYIANNPTHSEMIATLLRIAKK